MTREEAIRLIGWLKCTTNREDDLEAIDMAIETLSADTSSDLISRANAIRWVKTECNPYGKPTLDYDSGLKVIEHLKKMPSELQSAEAKTKCVAQIKVDTEEIARRIKEEHDITNEWIPCSERLPKRDELVLVTYKTTDRIHLCRYIDDGSENPWWSYIDDCCAWNNVVLAWMPLPKPYREDGE